MSTKSNSQTNRQLRGFVVIWTFITLIMGLATFLAIYFTYRQPSSPAAQPAEVALNTNNEGEPVVIASSTPRPATDTPVPQPTTAPTEAPAVAQQSTAVPTPAPTATPESTFTPPDTDETYRVGTQLQVPQDLNSEVLDGYLRSIKQDMGLNWIKKQVRWEEVEPEPGQYNWGELDLLFNRTLNFEVNVMLSIVTAPDWSREQGIDVDEHGPPADYTDYVNFVEAIFNRYPGQVFAIEVWNEQNLDREWTSVRGLSASDYVEMLRQTYDMVQEVSPGTIVISGALSPTGIDDGVSSIDDFRYMNLMIDAGLLDVADCIGAHHNGYNISPLVRYNEVPNDPTASFRGPFDNPHHSWSFRSTLEGYAQRISAAGSDKKLCVTEFGWAVSEDIGGFPRGFEFAADNTLQEQATYLVDALEYMEESDFVWLAFIWNFNYGPQAGWDPNNDNVVYSLIGPDNTFRPAFDAIREWQANYQQELQQS